MSADKQHNPETGDVDENEEARQAAHAKWLAVRNAQLEKHIEQVQARMRAQSDLTLYGELKRLVQETMLDNVFLCDLSQRLAPSMSITNQWHQLAFLMMEMNRGERAVDCLKQVELSLTEDDAESKNFLSLFLERALADHQHSVLIALLESAEWSAKLSGAMLYSIMKYGREQIGAIAQLQAKDGTIVHEESDALNKMLAALGGGIFATMADGLRFVDTYYERAQLLMTLQKQRESRLKVHEASATEHYEAEHKTSHVKFTTSQLDVYDEELGQLDDAQRATFGAIKLDRLRAKSAVAAGQLQTLFQAFSSLETHARLALLHEQAEIVADLRVNEQSVAAAKPTDEEDSDADVEDKVLPDLRTKRQNEIGKKLKAMAAQRTRLEEMAQGKSASEQTSNTPSDEELAIMAENIANKLAIYMTFVQQQLTATRTEIGIAKTEHRSQTAAERERQREAEIAHVLDDNMDEYL